MNPVQRRRLWKRTCIALVFGLTAMILGIIAIATSGDKPIEIMSSNNLITFYGYNDNDNGIRFITSYYLGSGQFGTAAIAYPGLHRIATEDLGTYDRPSTFATDTRVFSPGEKIYIPKFQKYFIMEDGCGPCTEDAQKGLRAYSNQYLGRKRIDLYIGPNDQLQKQPDLRNCQRRLTKFDYVDVIIRLPPRNFTVDETPFYSNITGCRLK